MNEEYFLYFEEMDWVMRGIGWVTISAEPVPCIIKPWLDDARGERRALRQSTMGCAIGSCLRKVLQKSPMVGLCRHDPDPAEKGGAGEVQQPPVVLSVISGRDRRNRLAAGGGEVNHG